MIDPILHRPIVSIGIYIGLLGLMLLHVGCTDTDHRLVPPATVKEEAPTAIVSDSTKVNASQRTELSRSFTINRRNATERETGIDEVFEATNGPAIIFITQYVDYLEGVNAKRAYLRSFLLRSPPPKPAPVQNALQNFSSFQTVLFVGTDARRFECSQRAGYKFEHPNLKLLNAEISADSTQAHSVAIFPKLWKLWDARFVQTVDLIVDATSPSFDPSSLDPLASYSQRSREKSQEIERELRARAFEPPEPVKTESTPDFAIPMGDNKFNAYSFGPDSVNGCYTLQCQIEGRVSNLMTELSLSAAVQWPGDTVALQYEIDRLRKRWKELQEVPGAGSVLAAWDLVQVLDFRSTFREADEPTTADSERTAAAVQCRELLRQLIRRHRESQLFRAMQRRLLLQQLSSEPSDDSAEDTQSLLEELLTLAPFEPQEGRAIVSLLAKKESTPKIPFAIALLRHSALIGTNQPSELTYQRQVLETEFAQTPLGQTVEFRGLLEELEHLQSSPPPNAN